MLPIFDAYADGPDAYDLTGLGKGGANIARLKKNYNKVGLDGFIYFLITWSSRRIKN